MIIGRGLDLDAVLRRVVESARRVVGARYAALGVLAPDHESLSRFIWSGFDDATAMNIGQLPSGRGLLGKLITDPRALRVEHIGGHPASSGFPAGHPPMETFLGVPVSLGDRVFGNLYLTDREGGPFTEEDERIAITLAAQAAVAIANARAAADERARLTESAALQAAHQREQAAADGHRGAIRAQEAERARVARELHDETGQVLTAVALELRALDGHLDAAGRDRLAGVRRTLASASESLRDLAIGLRPSGLAEHGLESALERQADRLRAGGGTNVEIAMAGLPPDLPEEVEIAVFRVVQEALTNVQRHAHARNVGVLVTTKGDRIRVLVEDDGVGFTPADPTDRLGLTGMRERIALIGGEVTVESSPGKGAVIVVEIPLRGGTAEQRS
jgi:signal transduction histidine kinase